MDLAELREEELEMNMIKMHCIKILNIFIVFLKTKLKSVMVPHTAEIRKAIELDTISW